jgi:hypothetical protein
VGPGRVGSSIADPNARDIFAHHQGCNSRASQEPFSPALLCGELFAIRFDTRESELLAEMVGFWAKALIRAGAASHYRWIGGKATFFANVLSVIGYQRQSRS